MARFENAIEDHAVAVYSGVGLAEAIDGWGSWNGATLARYHRDGFLLVRNAIPQELTDRARSVLVEMTRAVGLECIVNYEASLRPLVERQVGWPVDEADETSLTSVLSTISAHKRASMVRKFQDFAETRPALAEIATFQPLRQAIDAIVQEPARVLRSMALVKPPGGREKPWHQDHAFLDLPIESRICGVWIARDEASEENGAMFVVPGAHVHGRFVHLKRRDWQICDTDMAGSEPFVLTMQAGDLVVLTASVRTERRPSIPTDNDGLSSTTIWGNRFRRLPRNFDSQYSERMERMCFADHSTSGVDEL